MPAPLLEIRGLRVSFATRGGEFVAVDGIDLNVAANETLAIVGESGSGKSVAMPAILGLLPWTAAVSAERMSFDGHDLRTLTKKQRRAIIGRDITMIFQEPISSLNPCFTVGYQVGETLGAHLKLDRKQRRARVIELLEQVGIPDPARRVSAFPHQLSGGMRQRVMIAMALSCHPKLLIADEPTTALDVTIQAQILDLLHDLQSQFKMSVLLITHDLGVVAEMCQEVAVMYAGQIVEQADVHQLFRSPQMPYTEALLKSIPKFGMTQTQMLSTIRGVVPSPVSWPPGCRFSPRCD